MRLRRGVLAGLLIVVAAVTAGWIYSGRESVTKSGKNVVVLEEDITGEIQERYELRPGPLFGYYLGLDVLAGCAMAAGCTYAATWWFTRRSTRDLADVGRDRE